MKRLGETFVELVALATTTAYLFWRWADHASYGGPIGFALIFHLVIAGVFSIVGALFVWRIAPISPMFAIVTGVTLTVCICYMASMGQDLSRFRALGGPGSKEMGVLLSHQHIAPEAEPVFLEAAALRIQREFWFTGLIVLLLVANLSRLSRAAKDARAVTPDALGAPEAEARSQ